MYRFGCARLYSNLSYFHQIGNNPLKHIPFGKLLALTAVEYPERDAVISLQENKRITFGGLLSGADRLAAGLQQVGIKYGDRVGIWAPNILEWTVICFACARAGFIMVNINPNYTAPEIEYCINKVGLKTIFCPEICQKLQFYETLNTVVNNLPEQDPVRLINPRTPSLNSIITISEHSLGGTLNYNDVLNWANESSVRNIKENQERINPDSPVNIQFTSGTTGQPKAAVISHYNLVNSSLAMGKRNELDQKYHKICVQVPFFHTSGYTVSIGAAVAYGATIVIPSPRYNPVLNLQAIKKENCTVIVGTPTMYVDLVNVQSQHNETISLEIAVVGGAPFSPELLKKIKQHLNVMKIKSVYGLTEATAAVFQSMPSENEEMTLNTVGTVCDHLEVKVVDEYNNLVPIGTPGELCVRGYTTMLGYWRDRKKTDEMIDNHHWLKTGDQFIINEDGYGKIVGRLKDMIIRGGENIFPKEIEDFLSAHPDVLETNVIGLSHERLGEEVCACVRVREGAQLTIDNIAEFCNGKLAKFKIPTQLRIVDEFPKTLSGKIQKFVLKKQYETDRNM